MSKSTPQEEKPAVLVHPGGLGEEELSQARAAQQRLDVPYQEANCRNLGVGTTVLYTMPNEAPNRHRFEVVPALVVKQWDGGSPVLRVLGVHHGEDFTLWCAPFTVAQPGTPRAAGAWSWAYAGCPQCPCGKGCLLFTTRRCTACNKGPEEILAQWSAPAASPLPPSAEKGEVPQ